MSKTENTNVRNRNWAEYNGTWIYTLNEGENSVIPCVDVDVIAMKRVEFNVILSGVNANNLSESALNKRIAAAHPVASGHILTLNPEREIIVESAGTYRVTADTMREFGTTTEPDGPSIKYSVYLTRDAYMVVTDDGCVAHDYMHTTRRIPERDVAKTARYVALINNGRAYVATPFAEPERVTWYLDYETAKAHALTAAEFDELKNGGAVRVDK